MTESVLAVVGGFAGWIGLSYAIDAAARWAGRGVRRSPH